MRLAVLISEYPLQAFPRMQPLGLVEECCDATVIAFSPSKPLAFDEARPSNDLVRPVYYLTNPEESADLSLVPRRAAAVPRGRLWPALRALACGSLDLFVTGTADLPPRDSFDLLHCIGRDAALRGLFLKRTGLLHGKLIADLRGLADLEGRGSLRQLFRESDAVLAASEGLAAELRRRGCPPEKLRLRRPTVDAQAYAARSKRLGPGEPLRLIGLLPPAEGAATSPTAGLEDALRAVAQLRSRRPAANLRFDIFGKDFAGDRAGDAGEGNSRLAALARDLALDDAVEFHGTLRANLVEEGLAGAQVFLMPAGAAAPSEPEVLPFEILRAMASGLPVVSSWADGVPELVEHGSVGYLAPLGNVEVLARYLELFLLHPERLPSMSAAARTRVEAEFDAEAETARLLDLYAGLLGEVPPASHPSRPSRSLPALPQPVLGAEVSRRRL